MTFLKWIIGVPLVVAAIAFAVANGETVSFTYSPINEPLNWPLYALVLSALMIGFVIGTLMTWAAGHTARAERRALARQNKELQAELDKAKAVREEQDILAMSRPMPADGELY